MAAFTSVLLSLLVLLILGGISDEPAVAEALCTQKVLLRQAPRWLTKTNTKLYGGFGSSKTEEKDPGKVTGTDLKILKYPHPKLRAENERVTDFNDDLIKTAAEMLLVMYAADGVGLAAPQVGINKRLMVFNEDGNREGKDKEMILVNPDIVEKGGDKDMEEEGCLSFPQIKGKFA